MVASNVGATGVATMKNPIWSIESALRDGYVMEPHNPSGNFSGPLRMSRPSHECALVHAHIRRCMSDKSMKDENWGREACAKQCDECANICHMNDYIRAKEHCPPRYPMPALRDVRTLDLWLLYRPYPFQYVVQLRQSR